ncbi:MAG: cation:proton antiporter [Anaerolineae bacterium]|nr:cation:proton antiporter [Gloeobacterales cyanobacterium ES-bin-313]
MADHLGLIIDMMAVLGAASLGGYLASRLKQPVLLGYLLGGMVVGPAGFGLIKGEGDIQVLAEIGVALLLFALGVEFSVKDLLKVKAIALGGGGLQMLLTILLGGGLAYATGWVDTIPKAIFLGAILSLSSTAVVLKSLIERNELGTAHAQAMLAILIVQDLGLGLMLAVLPALTQPPEAIGGALAFALLKAVLFMAAAVIAGVWIVPPLIRAVARTASQELFILTVFVLCLGVALTTSAIGLGIEMGAFVAGLMISEVEYADAALDRVLPMRDVFATLFFASIGILIDPGFLLVNAPVLIGLVAVVMIGKALIVTPLVMVFGYPLKTALVVGLGLNQIGEFSFVLAGVAKTLGLFSERLYGLTVGTAAVTLVLTPFVIKASPALFGLLEQLPLIGPALKASQAPRVSTVEEGITGHVVVAGYGRIGQTLVRMLLEQNQQVIVIDNNEAATAAMRSAGIPYLYGDSASELVLEKAHLDRAHSMAIALPDPMATRLTLKRALSIAPELDVTVRAHIGTEIDTLYQLGAAEVVQPEFEASLEMGMHMLVKLGIPVLAMQKNVEQYRIGRYRSLDSERQDFLITKELEAASAELSGNWFILEAGSPLVGLTLAAADVRRLTGVSILEIKRNGQMLRFPGPDTVLAANDRLLVIGNREEDTAFERLLRGEVQLGDGKPERWLQVPKSSWLVGKSPVQADLRRQWGVLVQAIQREGKVQRFPDPKSPIASGDRLLVCASEEALDRFGAALESSEDPLSLKDSVS